MTYPLFCCEGGVRVGRHDASATGWLRCVSLSFRKDTHAPVTPLPPSPPLEKSHQQIPHRRVKATAVLFPSFTNTSPA